MPKSVVAGVSGAVRIRRLKRHELREAEDHGKRLDDTGKGRRIREAAPVTSTGLDIMDLYEQHIVGAFVPKGATVALHMICQFPTELVEASSDEWMLDHARAFAKTVFGDRATFADRVDRDERGEHVVDLFLAPRYTKKTKLAEKEAVSISKHMKDLAERDDAWIEEEAKRGGASGEPEKLQPNLFFQGIALQTAWFSYLRDQAQIPGVMRGSPKRLPGDDWMPAEVLDVERRQEAVADAEAEAQRTVQAAAAKEANALEFYAKVKKIEAARSEQLAIREIQLKEKETAAAKVEQAAAAAAKETEAFKAGIDAFARGDIVDAQQADGRPVLVYKDVATRDRLRPVVRPAFQAIWTFVKKTVERLAELMRATAEDRRIAADERAAAEVLSRDAQRKVDDATRRQKLLELDAERAAAKAELRNELAVQMAEGKIYRDEDHWLRKKDAEGSARLKGLMDAVPDAAKLVDEYLTSFGRGIDQKQRLLAAAQVTAVHIEAAAAKMVTPELLKDVIEKKVLPLEAAQKGLVAAAQARRTLDLGR